MEDDSFPEDFLNDFDVQLQGFYYRVIWQEVSLNSMANVHGINRAMKEVVNFYKKNWMSADYRYISFDNSWERCAYLLKYSTCFTSAVASYLLKLLNKNKRFLRESLMSGCINICCLRATDVVAIIKILRGLYHPRWLQSKEKLIIHVTVIDLCEGWYETANNVFRCLEGTPEFFGVEEMILSYKFIQADLTEPMSDEVKKAIKSADLLTLIYFLSAVNRSKAKEISLSMMQNIMLNMQGGACLFFLDSAADLHYEILNKAAKKRRSMQEIYGPLVEEFHSISIESVEKFAELYAKYFSKFHCMTNIFLCVSVWCKLKTIQSRVTLKEEVAVKPLEWKRPTEEESNELTEKMKQYRSMVRKVIKHKW